MHVDTSKTVSPDQFPSILDACFATQRSGIRGTGAVPYFEGGPGIGKTYGVKDYCDQRNIYLDPLVLGRMPAVELGGAYAPDFKSGELKHLILKRVLGYNKKAGDRDICILFDETPAAPPDTLVALASLLQERELEGYPVLDRVVFAAAGNRPEDGCGARPLPRLLREGRFVTIPVGVEVDGWLKWAEAHKLNPWVRGAIQWRGTLLHNFDPKSKNPVQASPRGWTKLSYLMDTSPTQDVLDVLGEGSIGQAHYSEFKGFCELAPQLASMQEILSSPDSAKLPTEVDGMYATGSNISFDISEIRKRGEPLEYDFINAVMTYLNRLPEEYTVAAVKLCKASHDDFANSKAYSQYLIDNQHLV